jgi:hypothetical protein
MKRGGKMTKEEYLAIIKRIESIHTRFEELDSDDEDYDNQLYQIWEEVNSLPIRDLKIELTPKKENEKIRTYVMLDSEGEFPRVFRIPEEAYEDVTEALYQVYTNYDTHWKFYDNVGIEPDTLFALIANYKGLPITDIFKYAGMNNVRYWNSHPYENDLVSMVSDEEEKIKGPSLF